MYIRQEEVSNKSRNTASRMCERGGIISSWTAQKATVTVELWTGWAANEGRGMKGTHKRTAGNSGLDCTQQSERSDRSYSERMPVFNFLFWKTLQSSAKPIRSNDPDDETGTQQFKLWHIPPATARAPSFLFTLPIPPLLQRVCWSRSGHHSHLTANYWFNDESSNTSALHFRDSVY